MIDEDSLRTKSLAVASQAQAHDDAADEVRAAEAETLKRVIEIVRPSLVAISSRIELTRGGRSVYGSNTPPDAERGLILDSDEEGELILRDDGALVADGDVGATVIDPIDAVYEWKLQAIVHSLSKALDAQLGGSATRRTEEMRARAVALRMVLAAVREVR